MIFENFNFKPYCVEPFLPDVRDYVEGGGALAMVGGDLSFASGGYGATALRDVLPVELPPSPPTMTGAGDADLTTDTFRPRLTPEGRTHPVTSLLLDPRDNEPRWARLPPLEGINRVPRVRNGATTLLTHPTLKGGDGKPAPVLVAADAGKGRTLALLTDSGWNWGFMAAGEGDDGRAFQRFWENAHPLAGARSGADAAAPGAGPARVPAQPADRGARARDARGLFARARRRGDADGRQHRRSRRSRADAQPAGHGRTPTARRTSTSARCRRAPTA